LVGKTLENFGKSSENSGKLLTSKYENPIKNQVFTFLVGKTLENARKILGKFRKIRDNFSDMRKMFATIFYEKVGKSGKFPEKPGKLAGKS
jgi:hypothetical protein